MRSRKEVVSELSKASTVSLRARSSSSFIETVRKCSTHSGLESRSATTSPSKGGTLQWWFASLGESATENETCASVAIFDSPSGPALLNALQDLYFFL